MYVFLFVSHFSLTLLDVLTVMSMWKNAIIFAEATTAETIEGVSELALQHNAMLCGRAGWLAGGWTCSPPGPDRGEHTPLSLISHTHSPSPVRSKFSTPGGRTERALRSILYDLMLWSLHSKTTTEWPVKLFLICCCGSRLASWERIFFQSYDELKLFSFIQWCVQFVFYDKQLC